MDQEQEKILEDALKVVVKEGSLMTACLQTNEIMEALKHASNMISELRTSLLSPKNYYKLFIDVTFELSKLEQYLKEKNDNGRSVGELYELVQYAGNIIPRLYLLITVGTVYMLSGGTSKKQLLNDLVEMCKGVQQPLRGLFLRNYLLTHLKALLPEASDGNTKEPIAEMAGNDIEEESGEGQNGSGSTPIEVIMTNFSEMNKLWVRMQHQGPSKEKDRREAERRELRILVGSNLVILSQLDNLTLDMYEKLVLPHILQQAISCHDAIAQEYLMECVIQVFPDEYHLSTLEDFLSSCAMLHEDVKVKKILGLLISRIATYVTDGKKDSSKADIHLFEVFSSHVESMISSRTSMPTDDIVSLEGSILNLAIKCWPEESGYASTVCTSLVSVFEKLKVDSVVYMTNLGKEVVKLLKIPIELVDGYQVLQIKGFTQILNYLDYRGRSCIARTFMQKIIDGQLKIKSDQFLSNLFICLNSLIVDQPYPDDIIEDNDEFVEEQSLMARLVYLIDDEDVQKQFELIKKCKKVMASGGIQRMKFTFPSIVNCVIGMAKNCGSTQSSLPFDREDQLLEYFKFCMSTINTLYHNADLPIPAFRLYLSTAIAASKIKFEACESIVYELLTKAFTVFEEDISDSKEQQDALYLLVGSIYEIECLSEENHAPLRNQCLLAVNRMLRKPDQAKMVCSVANLFWNANISDNGQEKKVKNGLKVLDCFKRALKVTAQCMEEVVQITLYIHILNSYIYFIEAECDDVTGDMVSDLITKIQNNIEALDFHSDKNVLQESLTRTLNNIKTSIETNKYEQYQSLNL
uniref:Vacuolar protein sorting-associated protein 35 n=1 Tax=Rhabditophanes sp. KR3021 TaxID=114890 RepID=A0AC35TY82_9BILA